jgi:hypothetical protein
MNNNSSSKLVLYTKLYENQSIFVKKIKKLLKNILKFFFIFLLKKSPNASRTTLLHSD